MREKQDKIHELFECPAAISDKAGLSAKNKTVHKAAFLQTPADRLHRYILRP